MSIKVQDVASSSQYHQSQQPPDPSETLSVAVAHSAKDALKSPPGGGSDPIDTSREEPALKKSKTKHVGTDQQQPVDQMQEFIVAPQLSEGVQVVLNLPPSCEHIQQYARDALALFTKSLDTFLGIPASERTFDNTIRAWDWLYAEVQEKIDALEALVQIYRAEPLRKQARETRDWLNGQVIETLARYPQIYLACSEVQRGAWTALSEEHQYYLSELMLTFKQMGMHLEGPQREELAQIKRDIYALECEFDRNIEEDQSVLIVTRAELDGLDEEWISSKRDPEGRYVLKCDLPTYDTVISQCRNRETRRRVHEFWFNCASKENELVAKKLISLRNQMAELLGFKSYADYELSVLMLPNSSEVQELLAKVREALRAQDELRFSSLVEKVPEAKDLMVDGRLARWDEYFLLSEFKKRAFEIDGSEVRGYFPVDQTIESMLKIYEEFFGLDIREVAVKPTCFPEDLRMLEVRKKSSPKLEGVILMDLYPRDGKGKHSAVSYYMTLGYSHPIGTPRPSLDLVSCNFEKGGTMRFQDMVNFFHEFGHTIHSVLGRSEFLSLSGKKVKRDFVETPSVLLERWMRSPHILRRISSHVQTHQPLPDALIEKIVQGMQLDEAIKMERFRFNNRLMLEMHEAKGDVKLDELMQRVWKEELPHSFPGNTHFYSSWWHFSNGARTKYHMYLIAETDLVPRLIAEIERRGRAKGLNPGEELVDPGIGAAYIETIVGKGGSQHPLQMVEAFEGK